MLDNTNFSTPAETGLNYAVIFTPMQRDFGACVAIIAALGLAAASDGLVAVASGGAGLAAGLTLGKDCATFIQSGISTVSVYGASMESVLFGAGNTILALGEEHGDFRPDGSLAIGQTSMSKGDLTPGNSFVPLSTSSDFAKFMTPGYAPPAAERQAFKADMTPKALATYFPHG